MFPLTQCTIHEYKAGNDVSELLKSTAEVHFNRYTI